MIERCEKAVCDLDDEIIELMEEVLSMRP
jgi:hypothetical protein